MGATETPETLKRLIPEVLFPYEAMERPERFAVHAYAIVIDVEGGTYRQFLEIRPEAAVIYFGVNNEHEVIGLDYIDRLIDVGSLSVVQLIERQQKIRELILKGSFISAQQMSVVLSVVKRTIERDIASMQKKGVLVREGNTSSGHWVVLDVLTKPVG